MVVAQRRAYTLKVIAMTRYKGGDRERTSACAVTDTWPLNSPATAQTTKRDTFPSSRHDGRKTERGGGGLLNGMLCNNLGRRTTSSAMDLLELHCRDELHPHSRWAWRSHVARTPPSESALAACGFRGSVWAPGIERDAANLLLLLHGLGDAVIGRLYRACYEEARTYRSRRRSRASRRRRACQAARSM